MAASRDHLLERLSAEAIRRHGGERAAALRAALAELADDLDKVGRFPLTPEDRPAFLLNED